MTRLTREMYSPLVNLGSEWAPGLGRDVLDPAGVRMVRERSDDVDARW